MVFHLSGGIGAKPGPSGHPEESATSVHGRVREAGGRDEKVLRGIHGDCAQFIDFTDDVNDDADASENGWLREAGG